MIHDVATVASVSRLPMERDPTRQVLVLCTSLSRVVPNLVRYATWTKFELVAVVVFWTVVSGAMIVLVALIHKLDRPLPIDM